MKLYEISENTSKRLNIIKLLFMILVVLIHSNMCSEAVYPLSTYTVILKDVIWDGICAVATPGFFFLSGLLLFSKEFTWMENIKKKVRTLLIPYFLINTFWILFFKGIRLFDMTKNYFQDNAYQINTIQDVLHAYFDPMPLYYPFWFVRDLFILNLIAKLIKIMIDKLPVLSLMVILVFYLEAVKVPLLHVNSSLCMFSISYYIVKYQCKLEKIDKIKLIYWGILFGILCAVKLWICGNGIISLGMVMVGLCFFYRLAGVLEKSGINKYMQWCSQFTFAIYAFHEFYAAMLKRIIMGWFPPGDRNVIWESLLITLILVNFCIVAAYLLKRYVPLVYKIICGSR